MILFAIKNRIKSYSINIVSLLLLMGFLHYDKSPIHFIAGFTVSTTVSTIIWSIVIFFDVKKIRRQEDITSPYHPEYQGFPHIPLNVSPHNERVQTSTTYAFSLYDSDDERQIVEEQQNNEVEIGWSEPDSSTHEIEYEEIWMNHYSSKTGTMVVDKKLLVSRKLLLKKPKFRKIME